MLLAPDLSQFDLHQLWLLLLALLGKRKKKKWRRRRRKPKLLFVLVPILGGSDPATPRSCFVG